MRRRARPGIPPGFATQTGAYRIQLDVFHRQPEVPLIQSAGIEPPLPQVAAAAVEAIDVLALAKVRPANGFGQRVFRVGIAMI